MVAVVQGFGPFGTLTANPSELVVRHWSEGALAKGGRPGVITEVLPVSRQRVSAAVPELMRRHKPEIWLGVGVAAGRPALSIEAVAVNLMHWSRAEADVDGVSVPRGPIADGGPAAHLTTLPVEAILRAWREAGIPGYLSHTAGSYLCNLSYYLAAQAAAELGIRCQVGFLHLPLLPELVDVPERQPSMAMPLQSAGLDLLINACLAAGDETGLYLRRTA